MLFNYDICDFVNNHNVYEDIEITSDFIQSEYEKFKSIIDVDKYSKDEMLLKFITRCIANRYNSDDKSSTTNFRNPCILIDDTEAYENVVLTITRFLDNLEDNLFIKILPIYGESNTIFYINNDACNIINFSKYNKKEMGNMYDILYQTGLFYIYYNNETDLEDERYKEVKYSVEKGYRTKTDIFEYLDVKTLKYSDII